MRIVIRKPNSVEQQLLDQLGVAIANKQVVRFTYNNLLRTVEPVVADYVEGTDNYLLRAWYREAPVDPELGKGLHWRLFQLAKIRNLTVLAECFVPRGGYQRADEDMSKIIHQL